MRTTNLTAARARTLAVFFLALVSLSGAVSAAESVLQYRQEVAPGESTLTAAGSIVESATLSLILETLDLEDGYPVDCVLVIDTSSTSESSLVTAKAFALDVIDSLGENDRVALVSFATTARLDVALTERHASAKAAVANLVAGGKSALGLGLQAARNELTAYGREDAVTVEILLCDGQSNTGPAPDLEGEIAADSGIMMISVGVGNLINRSLLEMFAEQTGGLFFLHPSQQALEEAIEHLQVETAARDIRIEKFLPLGVEYVSATPNPTSISETSTGTLVTWKIGEMSLGQERSIQLSMQAQDPGAWKKTDTRSRITYVDFRGVSRTLSIPPLVPPENKSPVAGFVLLEPGSQEPPTSPMRARVGAAAEFDAGLSEDVDGQIDRYEWDFDGDGVIDLSTTSASAEHTYDKAGTYVVSLTVTDNNWARSSTTMTVEVVTGISAVRTIETCLPDDRTAAGAKVSVTVRISAFDVVNGLSVTEVLPAGWTFTSVSNDGATLRQSSNTLEWVFLERLVEEGADTQREITYTLSAPSTQPSADEQVAIQGWVGSSSPRVNAPISGEDRITLVSKLSIPVVISRWDVENDVLDPCLQGLISFKQVQYAVSLWLSGAAVPYTGGATMTLQDLQDLIAYWLTASSAHDPLP